MLFTGGSASTQHRCGLADPLARWAPAERDLTAAIARLDELDAIEATNPYLFDARSAARSAARAAPRIRQQSEGSGMLTSTTYLVRVSV